MAPTKRTNIRPEIRQAVREKSGGVCWYCGLRLPDHGYYYGGFAVDHVIALAEGGPDELDNMVPACSDCNHAKGKRGIEALRLALMNTYNKGRDGYGGGILRFVFWFEAPIEERQFYGGHGNVGYGHSMPKWDGKRAPR